MRRQAERRAETRESRRGYVVGAAWDEGNMIQAMARLKNPTIRNYYYLLLVPCFKYPLASYSAGVSLIRKKTG